MHLSKQQTGYLEGSLSAVLNLVLFSLKLWAGSRVNSMAMIADAWHTLSDTLTSMVVVFGFWYASRPQDEEHPFGHGRAEVVAAIIIGSILAMVGASFIQDSIIRLREYHAIVYGKTALIIFAISILLKEGLAQVSIRLGKHIGSQSLIADGWHHRSDAIASALIVAGALAGSLFGETVWWLDSVMGIGVSLLILYTAYEIIKNAANTLMGEKPSREFTAKIQAIINRTSAVVSDVHHFHMHRYGDHSEVTFHVRLREDIDLASAHQAVTEIEEGLRSELGIEATIHLEPVSNADHGGD